MQQRLDRLGVAVEAHDPPRTRAVRVRATLGDAGRALAGALDDLDAARYGATDAAVLPGRPWWRRFKAAAHAASRSAGAPRRGRPAHSASG